MPRLRHYHAQQQALLRAPSRQPKLCLLSRHGASPPPLIGSHFTAGIRRSPIAMPRPSAASIFTIMPPERAGRRAPDFHFSSGATDGTISAFSPISPSTGRRGRRQGLPKPPSTPTFAARVARRYDDGRYIGISWSRMILHDYDAR